MALARIYSNVVFDMANSNDIPADDIKLTSEELYRLQNAFQDKEFLKLFEDYVQDINSIESRKQYEEEITLLEKERGYDVKFIHPDPFYVLKFVTKDKKIFINICKNQHTGKPTSIKKNGGTEWKIPVILSKPRDDVDKKQQKCKVYDVMFHPDTLEKASLSHPFRDIVDDTAVSMVSDNFAVSLDIKDAKHIKLKYKGKPPHVVLRHKTGSENTSIPCESLEEYWKKHIKPAVEKVKDNTSCRAPVTPKYTIKYRDIIDMKDFSLMGYTDKCAPKQIVIEIMLPGVQKADDVFLDVFERKIQLKSCINMKHHYNLDLHLSYAVNTDAGKAKFDQINHKLTVQLPLKDRGIPVNNV